MSAVRQKVWFVCVQRSVRECDCMSEKERWNKRGGGREGSNIWPDRVTMPTANLVPDLMARESTLEFRPHYCVSPRSSSVSKKGNSIKTGKIHHSSEQSVGVCTGHATFPTKCEDRPIGLFFLALEQQQQQKGDKPVMMWRTQMMRILWHGAQRDVVLTSRLDLSTCVFWRFRRFSSSPLFSTFSEIDLLSS